MIKKIYGVVETIFYLGITFLLYGVCMATALISFICDLPYEGASFLISHYKDFAQHRISKLAGLTAEDIAYYNKLREQERNAAEQNGE